MSHVEVPAQRMSQGMLRTKTGIAESHGSSDRGDAQLFQTVKRPCLNRFGQISDNEINRLQGLHLGERRSNGRDIGLDRMGKASTAD